MSDGCATAETLSRRSTTAEWPFREATRTVLDKSGPCVPPERNSLQIERRYALCSIFAHGLSTTMRYQPSLEQRQSKIKSVPLSGG